MKKENLGITPLDWILSIFGIIVLLCLIVLPPVFRVAFKEKVKPIDDDQPVVEYMTCSKENFVYDGHMTNDTIEFAYINNRISKYTRKTEMTFTDIVSYQQVKEEYGKIANDYSFIKNGVSYVVNADDGTLKIKVEQEFNLGTFQNTEITIPGDDTPKQITSDYTRNDLVSNIKTDLTDAKYICK
jgi:hypothetical protein